MTFKAKKITNDSKIPQIEGGFGSETDNERPDKSDTGFDYAANERVGEYRLSEPATPPQSVEETQTRANGQRPPQGLNASQQGNSTVQPNRSVSQPNSRPTTPEQAFDVYRPSTVCD